MLLLFRRPHPYVTSHFILNLWLYHWRSSHFYFVLIFFFSIPCSSPHLFSLACSSSLIVSLVGCISHGLYLSLSLSLWAVSLIGCSHLSSISSLIGCITHWLLFQHFLSSIYLLFLACLQLLSTFAQVLKLLSHSSNASHI